MIRKWKFLFKHLLSIMTCGNPYRRNWAWKRLKKFSNPILATSISMGLALIGLQFTRRKKHANNT